MWTRIDGVVMLMDDGWWKMEGLDEAVRKRCLAAAGAMVVGLVCFFLLPEEEASVTALKQEEPAVQPVAGQKKGADRILGMELAAKKEDLKDPFTLMHEDRESSREISGQGKMEAGKVVPKEQPPLPAGGAGDRTAAPADKEKKSAIVLQGVASGEGGRLALLSDGKESRSVTVGEVYQGKTVTEIGDTYICLSGQLGEERIDLPGI